MEDQSSGVQGMWWRFNNYQIFETPMPANVPPQFAEHYRYIRPAPGAELETYSLSVGNGSEPSIGHGSISYEAIRDIDLESDDAILDWCREFGLLGILPQRTVLIRLAPRWAPLVDSNDRFLFPSQTSYSRTSVGWHPVAHSTLRANDSQVISIDEEDRMEDWLGKLVDAEDTTHPPPSAIISRLFTSEYREIELGKAIGQYFPELPYGDWDTPQYPTPLSPEFWTQYGESLGEFRSSIRQFHGMVEALGHKGPLEHIPEQTLLDLHHARNALHSLISVSAALGIDEYGEYVPRWAFSSLLSIFAYSLWQDLVGGKSIRHCGRTKCRKVFLTAQYNREYCSDRCRQTEGKARYRARTSDAPAEEAN